jgi:hypothetical protein
MSHSDDIYIEVLRLPPFWTRDYSIRLYFTYNPEQNEIIYLVGQKKSWSELDTGKYIIQAVGEAKKYYREKGWF